jgi:endonuclease/exonuclease/phosphatase family metal-dependent hydrolase
MYIGTWNVMAVLKTGKMNEIADEMLKTQLQIIALQELRWKGVGQINKTKYTLLQLQSPQKTGQLGTGFMIRNEIKKNILSFEPYNERLCKLRIKGKFNNLSIISVNAPTEEKSDEEKEKFYEDLQIVLNKIPKHDIVIILGDLNAKIGKEEVYQNVAGKHMLHETSNRNGEWVCEYATANNMKIMSTYYQHKTIHKGTWISPDGNTLNQRSCNHRYTEKTSWKMSEKCEA